MEAMKQWHTTRPELFHKNRMIGRDVTDIGIPEDYARAQTLLADL